MKAGDKGIFTTPYDQYKNLEGKEYEVIRELTDKERDPEVGTMYKIKIAGIEIDAWPEELDSSLII